MNSPIDITRTPYSRRGSWLCVRPVHADALPPEMLLFEPLLDGQVIDYSLEADVRSDPSVPEQSYFS